MVKPFEAEKIPFNKYELLFIDRKKSLFVVD